MGITGLTEDVAIKEINKDDLMISTVDIFTPIHNDPIIMGKIAACNVTNDIFAKNALNIISYLSFLGVPTDQPQSVTEGLIIGQRQFLSQFNADINGGHTIINPWPLVGGMAIGIVKKDQFIHKQIRQNSLKGDLILTKPLGIQAAMACYRLSIDNPNLINEFGYDKKQIESAINLGIKLMTTSNYYVTKVIHEEDLTKYITAMTDVTGFGIKIHASEMIQERKLNIHIDTLPIISNTDKYSNDFGYDLTGGGAAETAGPVLLCIDTSKIDSVEIQRLLLKENIKSWKIGEYKTGIGEVIIPDDVKLIQVEKY